MSLHMIHKITIDGKYNIVKQIGQGAFGAIYSGQSTDGKIKVAIKLV